MSAGTSGVEQAWERFAAGDLAGAIALARQSLQVDDSPGASAALGYFLLKAGRTDEAAGVLSPALQVWPDHAPLHWYAGYLYQERGDPDGAAGAFLRACALNPELDEAAYALAWALHDLGRVDEALVWSARARARNATPQRLEQAGWLLLQLGRADEAAATYRQAIAAWPPSAPAQPKLHVHLAECLARQGLDREAAELLAQAQRRWPDDFELGIEWVWGLRARGDLGGALASARRLSAAHPQQARAWHVEGVVAQELGDLEGADRAFERCQQLDTGIVDALWRRAEIQHGWRHREGASWLLDMALQRMPGHAGALALRAQMLLEEGRPREARRLLVARLRRGIASPALWRMLAQAHAQSQRPRRAARIVDRLLAGDPNDVEALRTQGWLALDRGDLDKAMSAVRALLRLAPDDARARAQAAHVLMRRGLLDEAQRAAERAVVLGSNQAVAWCALGQLRLQQGRPHEAQEAAARALRLDPADVPATRLMATVLMTSARYGQAQTVLQRALESTPRDPSLLVDLSLAQCAAGRFGESLASLDRALAIRPDWYPALAARAQTLVEAGHDEALPACEALVRTHRWSPQTAQVLLRLLSLGSESVRRLLAFVPADVLRAQWRTAITHAVHAGSRQALDRLTQLGCEELDPDPWLQWATLYSASHSSRSTAGGLAKRARAAYRALKLQAGLCAADPPPAEEGAVDRPRIAYIASQAHQSLLGTVLAAHDPEQADIFLFTNDPPAGLPAHVRIQALDPATLPASCAVCRIDVAIDAGGLHPTDGQFEVLEAYARRIAPVQLGWLGCWGSAGGVFDAVLADEILVPASHAIRHDEEVLQLQGGAWCWQPPAWAPQPADPPSLSSGYVTFGVCSRSLKLDSACIDAFARTAAAVPRSSIRFIGEIARDWPLRRDVLDRMLSAGVAADRVFFDPFLARPDYLRWLAGVDVLLDSFPGNGGLSLLDPLWMGVPVVTLAGAWAGARQGASILHAIGAPGWVAASIQDFCDKAKALAADPQELARVRSGLRDQMLVSPLLDGRRVAVQIESFARRYRSMTASPESDPKGRVRSHANRMLDAWLALGRTIDLPAGAPSARPELSVIVVLYEQAGLSLRTLQALADQEGVQFETIIVDNASADRTVELLERLRGACVMRNEANIGFLRAARQGAQAAKGQYLLFLNSDATPQDGALRETLRLLRGDPGIGVLGARVVLSAGGLQEAGNLLFRDGSAGGIGRGEDPWHHAALVARDTDYVSGVFMATPAPVWRLLGGFDEAFAPAYYEDTDYCLRAWRAGLRVAYAPTVLVEHLEWGSSSGLAAKALMERNRELFLQRHQDFLRDRPAPCALPLDGDCWLSPDDKPRRPRLLILDNEVPHGFKGGGLPRAQGMLRALAGWPVTLLPLWEPHDHVHAVHESLPASVEVALGHGFAGLEAFLESRRGVYDVLLVSRPSNLSAIAPLRQRRPELFAGMRLVYDAEALFALREIARAGVLGRALSGPARRQRIASEVALAAGAADVLVVSQRDARYFRAAGFRTHILSHGVAVRRDAPGVHMRSGLLFVGAIHPDTPNEDGLLWFMREVMPLLRERLEHAPQVLVVGVCLSPRVAALAREGVRILGPRPDLGAYYDAARVFIAPVRFAGGVPAKVIEAAAAGVPVVASAVLVRQLEWQDGVDIRAARDAGAFAAAVATLLLDDRAWLRQQQAAWDQCALRYDPQMFGSTLRTVVEGSSVP